MKGRKKRGLGKIVAGCLLMQGCAFLQSRPINLDQPPAALTEDSRVPYLPYFLPVGRVRLQLDEECILKVSEEYVPDPEHMYYLEYRHSLLADDDVKITTTGEGFLSAISTKTKDRSGDSLVRLAQIARAALRLPAAPPDGARALGPVVSRKCQPADITLSDPFNIAQRQAAATRLKVNGADVTEIEIIPLGNRGGTEYMTPVGKVGIFYRPLLPYEVKIKTSKEAIEPATVVYLPNRSPILALDFDRAPYVENEYAITFTNGIPTDIHWKNPSEIYGLLNIPLDLVRAAVSIPAELLTVKINDAKSDTALLEQQSALIKAQLDLIAKQKELEVAQKK